MPLSREMASLKPRPGWAPLKPACYGLERTREATATPSHFTIVEGVKVALGMSQKDYLRAERQALGLKGLPSRSRPRKRENTPEARPAGKKKKTAKPLRPRPRAPVRNTGLEFIARVLQMKLPRSPSENGVIAHTSVFMYDWAPVIAAFTGKHGVTVTHYNRSTLIEIKCARTLLDTLGVADQFLARGGSYALPDGVPQRHSLLRVTKVHTAKTARAHCSHTAHASACAQVETRRVHSADTKLFAGILPQGLQHHSRVSVRVRSARNAWGRERE